MTVNAITDTKKGRTGISPTYLHTTQDSYRQAIIDSCQKQLSQISFHTLSFQKI